MAQHLRAFIAYRQEQSQLYYWRTRAGSEVDFIVYGPERFWAIEVKNARLVHKRDLHALQSFVQDYPEARPMVVYRGRQRMLRDTVLCIPCEEFLMALDPRDPPSW